MKKILLFATLCFTTLSALAFGDDVARTASLKDGTTLYVFQDGKMAMEDKYGNVVSMAQGQVMETLDGQKITMRGNETARLHNYLIQERNPGMPG